ncbi:MAG: class I SAM-dependent methyltransferase [Ktedonobacteraceae bacterium]|nr:class I SAM-dependent methyltransferase [Ktedonobacteraceae bacterium]
MPSEPSARREQPSTYFVQDRSSKAERDRVTIQDQMLTHSMGGVLPEQPDPALFHHILDVGCGTGSWLIDAAKAYPDMTTLVGADISISMVEYARKLAQEQGVSDRVEFSVMDALRKLEFPKGSFDLVNQRMGVGYLRTWDWPNLLQEYRRVTRSGGVIRITEGEIIANTNSPAVNKLSEISCDALFHAGHLFENECPGITHKLGELLHQQGLQNVQTRRVLIDHTEPGMMDMEKENIKLIFRTMLPFLQKWSRVPKDYDQLYQQALQEMDRPDFTSIWEMATAWGTNP